MCVYIMNKIKYNKLYHKHRNNNTKYPKIHHSKNKSASAKYNLFIVFVMHIEWMNEWLNKWINEWMNKWINE